MTPFREEKLKPWKYTQFTKFYLRRIYRRWVSCVPSKQKQVMWQKLACGRNQWFLSKEFGEILSWFPYLWISSPSFLASSNWSWCQACSDVPCKRETSNLNTVPFPISWRTSSALQVEALHSGESDACVCCTQCDYMLNRKNDWARKIMNMTGQWTSC